MSLRLEVPRDKPQGFWMMDDASPYNDYSGYGQTASSSTARPHAALAKGALYSSVFDRTIVGSFTTPVFQQGKEFDAFTLEAMAKKIVQNSGYTAQTYRENWATNPRFETATTNVSTVLGSIITRVTSERVVGAASIQVVTPGVQSAEGFLYENTTAQVPAMLTSTGYFTSTVLVKGAVAGGTVRAWTRIRYTDTTTSVDQFTNITLTTNWASYATTPVAVDPSKTIAAVDVFVRTNPTQAITYYVGGLTIENAQTSIGYFDGTYPSFEWTGSADNSVSRTRVGVAAVNKVNNPLATLTAGQWVGTNATISRTTADFYEGDSSILVTANSGSTFNVYFNGTATSATRIRPGQSVYHKTALKRGTYAGNFQIIFYWYKIDGTAASTPTTMIQTNISPTGWQVYNNTAVAPPDAIFSTVVTQTINAVSTGQTFMVDNVYYGPQDFVPFDGASPGAVWGGTAYASHSLMYISDSEQQILGHTGKYDGLVVSGTRVSFVTKYLTTGEARCTYDLQVGQAVHVVGVHTSSKNSLYINGALAAEVDITDAQRADQFVATDGLLYSGQTLSSAEVALNGVATYNYVLSADSIRRHYANARDSVDADSVAATFGGVRVPLSKEYQNVYLSQSWQDAADWSLGQNLNVSVQGDQLLPQFLNGSSVSGYWLVAVPLSGPATLTGINMNWDGEGAVVQASLDGSSWETATRGVNLALAPNGFNPANQLLHIKVSFPGGISNDTSFLDNLSVSAFQSGAAKSFGGWTISATNAYFEDEQPVNQFDENYGVELRNGTVTLTAGADATAAKTIEVWVKSGGNLTTNLSGYTSTYSNGGAATQLYVGEWQLLTRTWVSGFAGPVQITGTGQVGHVAIYPRVLTASEVVASYQSYMGKPVVRFTDSSVIQVTESSVAAEIYEYDWSIESAG